MRICAVGVCLVDVRGLKEHKMASIGRPRRAVADNLCEAAGSAGGKGENPGRALRLRALKADHHELRVIGSDVGGDRIVKWSGNGGGFAASCGTLDNPVRTAHFCYVEPEAIGDHVDLWNPVVGELRGGEYPGWRWRGTEPGKCPGKNYHHHQDCRCPEPVEFAGRRRRCGHFDLSGSSVAPKPFQIGAQLSRALEADFTILFERLLNDALQFNGNL